MCIRDSFMPAAGRRVGDEPIHHAAEFRCIERFADDAGRSQQHIAQFALYRRGGDLGGEFGRHAAGLAGERVGVAGIDDKRAGARCV